MQTQAEVQPASNVAAAEQVDLDAVQSFPWLAIALAVHVLMLVTAWFVMPHGPERAETYTLAMQREQDALPPEPVQPPEDEVELPTLEESSETTIEDRRIVDKATDLENSDPTDQPMNELAEADTLTPTNDSPLDKPNPNTSLGLAGGSGGGPAGGERGGLIFTRSDPGKRTKLVPPEAVADAHRWLADHQNIEGYWSATTFNHDSTRQGARRTYNREFVKPGDPTGDKGWEGTVDVGLTGLAMLAFTGELHTHKEGKFRNTMRRALTWLRQIQHNDGCFGDKADDHFVYNHAIATMAVAEVYMIEGDPMLRPIVERAVQFILSAQNPGAGWRYGVRAGDNDSSVTGWMVLTLHTAKVAGLEFNEAQAYTDAESWFRLATTSVAGYPRTGYNTPGSNGARLRTAQEYADVPAMDAIHIMSMLFMRKADTQDATMRAQAAAIVQSAPEWKHEKLDFYYWYYASLALYQMGGSHWDKWEKPMTQALLNSQRGYGPERHETSETLDEHGSWDPVDAWGSAGGRVYSTAINCLTLQVWYRYERNQK